MCVKKFIFSKFAGLQNYSWQLYYQTNFFTDIFRQYFKSSHAPPMYWLKPAPPIKFWRDPPRSQHLWETLGHTMVGAPKQWTQFLQITLQYLIQTLRKNPKHFKKKLRYQRSQCPPQAQKCCSFMNLFCHILTFPETIQMIKNCIE